MKILTLIVALVAGVAVLLRLFKAMRPHARTVSIADIQRLLVALGSSRKEPAFAVLLLTDPHNIELQFAVSDGKVGMEWTLLAPNNIKDRAKVTEYCQAAGYRVHDRTQNRVEYLRVEGAGVSDLGAGLLRTLYGVTPEAPMELIAEGIEWNP
jgi:hypothetical protein